MSLEMRPPGAIGPAGDCNIDICPIEWTILRYRPSIAANAALIGLYAVALCIHVALGIRWKTWFFMWSIVIGCATEIIGYGGRIMLNSDPFSFNAFMMQIISLTFAPVFFSAAVYVTIANMVRHLDPSVSRFNPKLYYWVFLICDIISLGLQSAGGALSSRSNGRSQAAIDVALAGLGFQVATLVIFCALVVDYLVRYFKHTRPSSVPMRLKLFLSFLALAVLLILARCAYRVDELREGYLGHLIHDEVMFMALEGALVVCAVYALIFGHPGLVFRPRETSLEKNP